MALTDLLKNINVQLANMDRHLAAAKDATGMKPRLDEAKSSVQLTDDALSSAADSVMALKVMGIEVSPDVVLRIRRVVQEMMDVHGEIMMCEVVMKARETKSARATKPQHASN